MVDFDKLLSANLWEKVVYVLGGYVLAQTTENVVSSRTDANVPPELYGVASVALTDVLASGSMATYMMAGAGFHSLESVLERFDVKTDVLGFGDGA